jgi:hypothetical protein
MATVRRLFGLHNVMYAGKDCLRITGARSPRNVGANLAHGDDTVKEIVLALLIVMMLAGFAGCAVQSAAAPGVSTTPSTTWAASPDALTSATPRG